VAGLCFAAYARIREWVVLAGGVVGATLVVPEFLYDVTDGSLGASGVMLVAGVTLLAGGLAGMRIRPHRR
jgi:predicted phage tail protein